MFAFHASRSTGLPSDGSSIPGRSSSGSTHTVAALTAIRALCPGRGPRPPWPAGAVAVAGALPAPSRAAAPPAAPVAASVKPARREKRAEDRGRVGDIRISSCVSVSGRSEEHTSELQSRGHLVCRLLLEKKKERSSGAAG